MKENTGRLAGKVAIVTGGNSGIGASTVELFVKEGSRVMIAARGEEAGQTLADRLGQNAHFIRTDVSVEADVTGGWGIITLLILIEIGAVYLTAQDR